MLLYYLEREQWLPRPIEEVFSFFSRPENLQVITPSWLDFRVIEAPDELEAGALIRYRLRWRRWPIRWTTEFTVWNPPHGFVDRQLSGPYALWNHEFAAAVFDEFAGNDCCRGYAKAGDAGAQRRNRARLCSAQRSGKGKAETTARFLARRPGEEAGRASRWTDSES